MKKRAVAAPTALLSIYYVTTAFVGIICIDKDKTLVKAVLITAIERKR